MFTDTMTIFNHIETSTGSVWQKSILKGVQWRHNSLVTSDTGTEATQTRAESITIDCSRNYGNKPFLPSNSFQKETHKDGFFTLDTNGLDIAVLGECDKEITASYSLKDLRKDYDYCGTIRDVSDNTNRTFNKNIKMVVK